MFSASQCTRKYLALALVLSFQDVRAWGSTFRLSAAGDVIGEVKDVSSGDPYVKAVYDLVRESDFEPFNMEGNIFNLATFPGYPASENGKDNAGGGVGGGARYEAEMAAALAAVGFTMASHANNHALMPADHLQNMTRSAIDAGASIALVHGAHYPRAVEVYKGRAHLLRPRKPDMGARPRPAS